MTTWSQPPSLADFLRTSLHRWMPEYPIIVLLYLEETIPIRTFSICVTGEFTPITRLVDNIVAFSNDLHHASFVTQDITWQLFLISLDDIPLRRANHKFGCTFQDNFRIGLHQTCETDTYEGSTTPAIILSQNITNEKIFESVSRNLKVNVRVTAWCKIIPKTTFK